MATAKYLYALPMLNKALNSPDSAKSDSTLLAVLLLDLFEKITNTNPRSTDSWMSHVNGALTLVKLRDNNRFHDYTGLRLSVRLSTNLLISCIAASAGVPPALVKLRSDLEPFLNKDDPKWRVSGLVVKYTTLTEAMQDHRLTNANIVACATELDREFMSLAETMPSTSLYHTMYLEEAAETVLEQHFHTYPDHFTTQTWNTLRIMRILLNNAICTYSVHVATESFGMVSASRSWSIAKHTLDIMAKEICAAAAQYTGYGGETSKSKDYSATQRLRCYTLLFPFYVAALYASPTTNIKPWVIQQLRFMSCEIGVRNASVVAEILETSTATCPWSVYAILGSYAFAA